MLNLIINSCRGLLLGQGRTRGSDNPPYLLKGHISEKVKTKSWDDKSQLIVLTAGQCTQKCQFFEPTNPPTDLAHFAYHSPVFKWLQSSTFSGKGSTPLINFYSSGKGPARAILCCVFCFETAVMLGSKENERSIRLVLINSHKLFTNLRAGTEV